MLAVLPHTILVDLAVDSVRYKLPAAVWNTVSLGRVLIAHTWALCVVWTLLRAPTQETETLVCMLQTPDATAWELAQNAVVTGLWTARTCLRLVAVAVTGIASYSWVTYFVFVGLSVVCYTRT